MAALSNNQFLIYLISNILISNFVTSSEYFNDDITKVFRGVVDQNPNDIQFYSYPNHLDVNQKFEIIFGDTNTLGNYILKPNSPFIFIVHGFRSNVSSEMPQTLKNAFLQTYLSINIIVVNWGPLSTPLPPEETAWLYYLVPPNVPIVAKRLAQFIIFLWKTNFIKKLRDVYIIGHSLGAHVAGLAGKEIYLETNTKIGRITGLDPAGPLYFPSFPNKNLMKDNALFVDIIHTNSGLLGSLTNDGHADFWPNGGCSQPNCEFDDTSSIATLGRCSHQYAYHLFAASITKSIHACPCEKTGYSNTITLCDATCHHPVSLGFRCPQWARGVYYASTKNPQ